MAFHGGREFADADPHMFLAVSEDRDNDELSYLSVVMPLSWADTHSPEDFVDWTIELCEAVGPTHGYAGPFVVPHVMGLTDDSAPAVCAIGRRLQGVEVDIPTQHAAHLAARSYIKGINWLTILSDAWAVNLNRPEPLVRRLGSARLRTFASANTGVTGIVLRTGAAPMLGDTTSQLPAYRHVAALTAPLRSDDPAVLWPQGFPGFDLEESLAWMRRFD
jgi:hypothetical protein